VPDWVPLLLEEPLVVHPATWTTWELVLCILYPHYGYHSSPSIAMHCDASVRVGVRGRRLSSAQGIIDRVFIFPDFGGP